MLNIQMLETNLMSINLRTDEGKLWSILTMRIYTEIKAIDPRLTTDTPNNMDET